MNSRLTVELFTLKCAPIRAELDRVLSNIDPSRARISVANSVDTWLKDYTASIPLAVRTRAAVMAEYYRIFYMFETYVRDFIVEAMEEEHGTDWWDASVPDHIREGAKRSRDRELHSGVTPRSDEWIVYTTFGELMGIMSANWELFGGIFPSPKGLEAVMSRLNTLRGPIMHCGTLAEDEILRLQLAIRDWFNLPSHSIAPTEDAMITSPSP